MKLSTPMLRQTAMTVGGVEARHMAILGHFIQPPMMEPDRAFQPTDKAIDPSFSVSAVSYRGWGGAGHDRCRPIPVFEATAAQPTRDPRPFNAARRGTGRATPERRRR